jgi:hypothetical protein
VGRQDLFRGDVQRDGAPPENDLVLRKLLKRFQTRTGRAQIEREVITKHIKIILAINRELDPNILNLAFSYELSPTWRPALFEVTTTSAYK